VDCDPPHHLSKGDAARTANGSWQSAQHADSQLRIPSGDDIGSEKKSGASPHYPTDSRSAVRKRAYRRRAGRRRRCRSKICEADFYGGEWARQTGARDEATCLFRRQQAFAQNAAWNGMPRMRSLLNRDVVGQRRTTRPTEAAAADTNRVSIDALESGARPVPETKSPDLAQ